MSWIFDPLERGKYGLILADPPWNFAHYSRKGIVKSAQAHYDCMSHADLEALPVADLAAPDCALVMWATAPMLPQAIALMAHWGFLYKTSGAWAKRTRTDNAWAFGTGYVFRSAVEFYIVGARGKPKIGNRSTRNLLVAPVREHSRKPDLMHTQIEALFPAEHRCELFARQSRPGWHCWGNESNRFDEGVHATREDGEQDSGDGGAGDDGRADRLRPAAGAQAVEDPDWAAQREDA